MSLTRDFLLATTGRWSANAIYLHSKMVGLRMNRGDALFLIDQSFGPPTLFHNNGGTRDGTGGGTGTGTGSAQEVVPAVVPGDSITPSPTPPSRSSSSSRTRPIRRDKSEEDTSWVEPLVSELKALRKTTLEMLTVEHRVVLGRYHALKFGNCTKSETRNRSMGARLAKAFAGMAVSELRSMSVEEYVVHARRYHEVSGGAPWFDPWLIKGVLERPALQNGAARYRQAVAVGAELQTFGDED